MPVLFIHSPARKTPIWQWQGCPERSRCSWRFCLTRAEMSGETTKARANERRNWVGFTHPAPFQQKPPAMQARRKDIVFFCIKVFVNGVVRKEMPTVQHDKGTNKQTNKQTKQTLTMKRYSSFSYRSLPGFFPFLLQNWHHLVVNDKSITLPWELNSIFM